MDSPKRIFQLDQSLEVYNNMLLMVDRPDFAEATYISVQQLFSSIDTHPPVTLFAPNNGLILIEQTLGLVIANFESAGALPMLPNNANLFLNGVGNWVEVSGGGDSFWQRIDETLSPLTANDVLYVASNQNNRAIHGKSTYALGGFGVIGECVELGGVGVVGTGDSIGVTGESNNIGVYGIGTYVGVWGYSAIGYGGEFTSDDGYGAVIRGGTCGASIFSFEGLGAEIGIEPEDGSSIKSVLKLYRLSTADIVNGIGQSIDFIMQRTGTYSGYPAATLRVVLTDAGYTTANAAMVWALVDTADMTDVMALNHLGRLSVAAGYAVNTNVGISYTDASITIVGGIVTSFTGFGTSDSYGYWVLSTFDTETMPVSTNVTTHKVVRFIGDGDYINVTHEVISDEILVSIAGIPDGHVTVWNRDEGEIALVPTTITDAVMLRSTSNLGILTLGETGTIESIVFGIKDLADSETYDTHIKWFTNGAENDDVLRLGITGTGTSAIANFYTELVRLRITTPYLDLITDYDYSNAFHTEIRRDYAGVVASRLFNSAISTSTSAYVSKIIGVHPSTSNYATVNITVTGKEFAGIVGEWEDNGTNYLKHSANIVTGGTIKPALNIGTRSGQPIRFFVGGASDIDFDNTTLRQVMWDNGNISIGGHGSISTNKAMYSLDTLTGDIRLIAGKLVFGGTIGSANAATNLYKNNDHELVTDNLFKAIGGYKSADGTVGITASGSFDTSTTRVISITVKNGLITAFTITGGA